MKNSRLFLIEKQYFRVSFLTMIDSGLLNKSVIIATNVTNSTNKNLQFVLFVTFVAIKGARQYL